MSIKEKLISTILYLGLVAIAVLAATLFGIAPP